MDHSLAKKNNKVNDDALASTSVTNKDFTSEEITDAMSGHLQHAHADSSQHGLAAEDFCDMRQNKENIDPTRVKHNDGTHEGWLLNSKPECQVSSCK